MTERELDDSLLDRQNLESAKRDLQARIVSLRDLPQKDQNSAVLEELVTLTFTIQSAIIRVRKQTREDIKRENDKLRAETQKVRRRVALTVVTAVVIAFFVTIAANNLAIKHCFLGTNGQLNHSSFCNDIFPGYNASIDRENKIFAQFREVLAQIPKNRASLLHVNLQLDRIERELRQLRSSRVG